MSKVEITESDHLNIEKDTDDNEIGEIYDEKGYSKLPIDQINLNTPPISINSDYNHQFIDNNIKSYIKVFLGFAVFVILIFTISILSGHFHYEKIEENEKEITKNKNLNKNINIQKDNSQIDIKSEKNKNINDFVNNKNVTNNKKFR